MNTNSDNVIPLSAHPNGLQRILPTEEEFVVELALDSFCNAAALQVSQPNAKFHLDDFWITIGKSTFDDAIRMVIPEFLRK